MALPVEVVSVYCPVQFVFQLQPKELVGTHNLHLVPIDLDWSFGWSRLPEVYDHFLGFEGVELQVVGVTAGDEVPHQAPVLLLLITPNTSHNGRVVGELLDMT